MPSLPSSSPSTCRSAFWLCLPLLGAVALGAGAARSVESPAAQSAAEKQKVYEQEIKPTLSQLCGSCHGAKKPRAGVDLSSYDSLASIHGDAETWRSVLTQLQERSMPPQGSPQPSPEQHEKLVSWIRKTLEDLDSQRPRDPGRVLIHRLNRTEYNNTLRDLLGITSKPADAFPADGSGGGGFDNNADTLFVPPILMEKYLDAASQALAEARPELIFTATPRASQNPAESQRAQRTAARAVIGRFARRAFRRPLAGSEMERLMSLYDGAAERGLSYEPAVKVALKAVLVSPNFLFRVEQDQPGQEPYAISDYELASRLSYFLWSSMPDDELLGLAGQKRLREPQVLEAQVERMVASPKFGAFAHSFAGQWLRVRDLYSSAQPDPRKFPDYTPSLRDAMYNEAVTFFQDVMRGDASLMTLLDADYTFLNEELAKHYGIGGVQGAYLRRVPLKEGKEARRGGVVTMASVLTISSYPQRTSPVLRGKWVLEEILGTPPPPPPPDAGGLSPNDAPEAGLSFRQRLEKHREKPQCASCHVRMDPLGFGLENFDATGKWRDEIGGAPVDSTGVLASGEKFSGPAELKKHLLSRREDFTRNFTERMLSYALGRGLEPHDSPTVRDISAKLEAGGYKASTLILEVVRSYPFQFRKNA